jgi:hypothetical protein
VPRSEALNEDSVDGRTGERATDDDQRDHDTGAQSARSHSGLPAVRSTAFVIARANCDAASSGGVPLNTAVVSNDTDVRGVALEDVDDADDVHRANVAAIPAAREAAITRRSHRVA